MEVLRANSSHIRDKASSVSCGAGKTGSDEGSNSRSPAIAGPGLKSAEEGTVGSGCAPRPASRAGCSKSPPPRVLSHLFQLTNQWQHPVPCSGAAAANILSGSISAPTRTGVAHSVDVPCPPAAAPSSASFPAVSGCVGPPAFLPRREITPAGPLSANVPGSMEACSAAAAVARLAAAARASTVVGEPGLVRPSTVEEETLEQLLAEQEEEDHPAEAAATQSAGRSSATPAYTVCAVTPERGGPVSSGTLPEHAGNGTANRGEDLAAPILACAQQHREGTEDRSTQFRRRGSSAATEAIAQKPSASGEVLESCVVSWKPTCLTEISFDNSAPSTRGNGTAGTRSLCESPRSTTSEPAEILSAPYAAAFPAPAGGASVPAVAGSCMPVAANGVGVLLGRKRPSASLGLLDRAAVPPVATRPTYKRQSSVNSESDGAPPAATEGIPSNVSRWRLSASPVDTSTQMQQEHQAVQQEVREHQQKAGGLVLKHHENGDTDGQELPLQQQQLEERLDEQKAQEEERSAVQPKEESHALRGLVQEQVEFQGIDVEHHTKHGAVHQQQESEAGGPLSSDHGRASLLVQGEQNCEAGGQLQLSQAEQPQKQKQPLRHDHVEAVDIHREHFSSCAVQQRQDEQEGQEQQAACNLGPQCKLEEASLNQEVPWHPQQPSLIVSVQRGMDGVGMQYREQVLHVEPAEPSCKAAVPLTPVVAATPEPTQAMPAETPGPEVVGQKDVPVAEDSNAEGLAALTAAGQNEEQITGGSRCSRKSAKPRVCRRRRKASKGGRFVQTSSSGYPGVSWNRRMGAWLAFFYDTQSRRSRTFHPRYFNGDIEATRIAAIEFKKSVDKLFSFASKPGGSAKTDSSQKEQRNETGEEKQRENQLEEEGNQSQQHALTNHRGSLSQNVFDLAASLLPQHTVEVHPMQQRLPYEKGQQSCRAGTGEQERAECSRSGGPTTLWNVAVRDGDGAETNVAVGRKRGREDDSGKKSTGAAAGCLLSQHLTLASSPTFTDLASALFTSTSASDAVTLTSGGTAAASYDSEAVLFDKRVNVPTASIAKVASSSQGDRFDVAASVGSAGKLNGNKGACGTTTAAASPPHAASLTTAVTTAAHARMPELDLSVLAAMGSHDRLRKALSFGADLQARPAHRLGSPWNRLSTLSGENLQFLARNSTLNLQFYTQGAGAASPATREGPAAAADAANVGHTAAAAIFQLLSEAQGEKQKSDDRHNSNMPDVLQQLHFNAGASAATLVSRELQFQDAAMLRENNEELHRILEEYYSPLPVSSLCSEAPRSHAGASNAVSRSETSQAYQLGNLGMSFADDSRFSSSSNNRSGSIYCESRVDGTTSNSSGGPVPDNSKIRCRSSVALADVQSGEKLGGVQERDAWSSSLERIRHFLTEGDQGLPAGERDAAGEEASTASLLAHAQSIIKESFCTDTFTSEVVLKHAVGAFDLHWPLSGQEGNGSIAASSANGPTSAATAVARVT